MSLVETLKQASDGLVMPSENDYPFEAFLWEGQAALELTTEKLLQLSKHPADLPVEIVALDYFFRNVAQEKAWHDAEQKENVRKFQALVEILKKNLSNLKVYRIGIIDIDVYIIGQTASGDLAGLSTKIVET